MPFLHDASLENEKSNIIVEVLTLQNCSILEKDLLCGIDNKTLSLHHNFEFLVNLRLFFKKKLGDFFIHTEIEDVEPRVDQ